MLVTDLYVARASEEPTAIAVLRKSPKAAVSRTLFTIEVTVACSTLKSRACTGKARRRSVANGLLESKNLMRDISIFIVPAIDWGRN